MSALARTRSVALTVAWRSLHNAFTNPAIILPSVLFPLFFFVAFAGGLSNVQNAPDFDYPGSYTAFQFGFVCIQAAAFGGVFTGFSIAADFEFGFARRLLLAAPNRGGIVIGYMHLGDGARDVRADGRARRGADQRHGHHRLVGRHARRCSCSRSASARRRRCGRPASRCACARCRPGRSCRCRSSSSSSSRRSTSRSSSSRAGCTTSRGSTRHGAARGVARVHRRRADEGRHRRRVHRGDVRARRPVGARRAALGRSRRLTSRRVAPRRRARMQRAWPRRATSSTSRTSPRATAAARCCTTSRSACRRATGSASSGATATASRPCCG